MRIDLMAVALAAVIALGTWSAEAHADEGPDEDYVETCTLDYYKGQDCKLCDASYEDPEACQKLHGAAGYEQQCRSWGGSFWDEVWCKPGAKAVEPAKASEEKTTNTPKDEAKKCSVSGLRTSATGPGSLLGLVLLATGFWFRARRRS